MNERIKQALLSASDKVYLYTAKGNTQPPYLIYGTDGDISLFAGGHRAELCDSGYVDLFTRSARDPLITAVPAALDEIEAAFYLNSVQYEDETGLLHYEWRWQCVG